MTNPSCRWDRKSSIDAKVRPRKKKRAFGKGLFWRRCVSVKVGVCEWAAGLGWAIQKGTEVTVAHTERQVRVGGGTGYKDDSWLIIALLPPSLGSCMVALAFFPTNVTNPSLGRVRGAPSRGVLTVGSWCDLLT